MINPVLMYLGSYSVILPLAICLVRYKRLLTSYRPFIWVLMIYLVTELISTIQIQLHHSNAVVSNISILASALVWTLQFKKWDIFDRLQWQFRTICLIIIIAWIIENVALGKIGTFSSAFSILYSFILVFLGISLSNRQIVEERRSLFKNSKFLISMGVIIFHTYRILVECFYLLELKHSDQFLMKVFSILIFINLFVNLVFAYAALWIPTRQRFILPSS